MKKLLGIVVLGLLLMNNAYPNTPSKKFVYEKLYNEYSTCTVYYKFLNRQPSPYRIRFPLTDRGFLNKCQAVRFETYRFY